MASEVYPKYMEAVIQGSANSSLAGTVKAAMVDSADVTYNAAHDFFDDISAGVVGTPVTVTNKTYTNGLFDFDNIVDYDLNEGDSTEAMVVYIDTGVAGTSRLVAWIEGFTATPSGASTCNITWAGGVIQF